MPARMQTLRAAIDWSYQLLEAEEKRLFDRLSVFQGGRTIEAVEMVGAVFSTLTLAVEVAVELSESVAVAVHVMVDPTSVSEADTVYVLPVPTLALPTDHA